MVIAVAAFAVAILVSFSAEFTNLTRGLRMARTHRLLLLQVRPDNSRIKAFDAVLGVLVTRQGPI
jgi:hypothetical protein